MKIGHVPCVTYFVTCVTAYEIGCQKLKKSIVYFKFLVFQNLNKEHLYKIIKSVDII